MRSALVVVQFCWTRSSSSTYSMRVPRKYSRYRNSFYRQLDESTYCTVLSDFSSVQRFPSFENLKNLFSFDFWFSVYTEPISLWDRGLDPTVTLIQRSIKEKNNTEFISFLNHTDL